MTGASKSLAVGVTAFLVVAVAAVFFFGRRPIEPANAAERTVEQCYSTLGGVLSFDFERSALDRLKLGFVVQGHQAGEPADYVEEQVAFDLLDSTLTVRTDGRSGRTHLVDAQLRTRGAMLVDDGQPRVVVGNLTLGRDSSGSVTITSHLGPDDARHAVFTLPDLQVELNPDSKVLEGWGTLTLDKRWAEEIGRPWAGGMQIGAATLQVALEPSDMFEHEQSVPEPKDRCEAAKAGMSSPLAGVIGPDVIVADLQTIGRYSRVGNITAYAIGTHACNLGDERAAWVAETPEHPVIIQNMYKLKDDRFSQIGMAWVKHGFYAVSWSLCGPCEDPTDGSELGVGCSDPYSAGLNAVQSNMSPRADVNGFTGIFPVPWDATVPPGDPIIRRLQVHDDDLEPDLNADARYFIEGHYVLADDAAAGNSENNASYREVQRLEVQDFDYRMVIVDQLSTQREQPAVRAWQDADPTVVETDLHVPAEGLFILGAKAVDLGTGEWRYEYALQNLNSDRAAGSFRVPIPDGAVVSGIGFEDAEYHSGDPQDGTDWTSAVANGYVTWATEDFSVNPQANALRFSTLYNFYFTANTQPASTTVVVGLFKPGAPSEIDGVSIGPELAFIDCNRNGVADVCDVDCNAPDCVPPCGTSTDCNGNSVPDECEPDCNMNGVADQCDILSCPQGELWCADCNSNTVPDECEPDCDGDGIPDSCDTFDDTDADGVPDCFDLCPLTTPRDTCSCPDVQLCCFPPSQGGFCVGPIPVTDCEPPAMPVCIEQPCVQGCLVGDADDDGDLDLQDFHALQQGYSGDSAAPGYQQPTQEYWLVFDFDDDEDIDALDYREFHRYLDGPG